MAIKTYNDQNFVAIANAIRSKSKNPTTYKPSEMAAAISAIESGFELLPQDTVSGAIANFPDGSDGYPVVELIANIEPKQSGSGDPAPDNVRPISGYTGMSITNISEVKTISWESEAGTVYGGTLNVTTGELTVNRAIVDIGLLNWTYMSSIGFFECKDLQNVINGNTWECISDIFRNVKMSQSGLQNTDLGIEVNADNGSAITGAAQFKSICATNKSITSVSDFLQLVSGHYLVYKLANPETYQLTPEQVKTLLGVNNIYSDTGNVSVTYRADVDLYIAKKIAEGA